jgi:hypothetical protein
MTYKKYSMHGVDSQKGAVRQFLKLNAISLSNSFDVCTNEYLNYRKPKSGNGN